MLAATQQNRSNNNNVVPYKAPVTKGTDITLFKVTDPAWIKWYSDQFKQTWTHPNKEADIVSIYGVNDAHRAALLDMVAKRNPIGVTSYTMKDHDAHNRRVYYHGTRRACKIGEATCKPCKSVDCHLCCILRQSLRLEHAKSTGMFGAGIYSTPNSSKADCYAKNHHIHSNKHAIIVCTVVKGKRNFLRAADKTLTSPGKGYDSVQGVTRAKGGVLNYSETVVYREDAIIPRAIIIYTRKGWSPGS